MAKLEDLWIVTNISGILYSKSPKPGWNGKPYRTIHFVNAADHKHTRHTYISEGMANDNDQWREVFNNGVGTVLSGLILRGHDQIDGDSSKTQDMCIFDRLTLSETQLFVRTGNVEAKKEIPEDYPTFGNGLFEYQD